MKTSTKKFLNSVLINVVATLVVVILFNVFHLIFSTSDKLDIDKISLNSFYFIWEYRIAFLSGMFYTLVISLSSILLGTGLAVFLAYVLTSNRTSVVFRITKAVINIYILFFLSIPALVLIVFIYYGSFGFNLNSIISSIIALSLNLSPFATRIIESSIKNINEDHIKTAYSFGYSSSQILKKIKIPIIFTNSFEPILVQWITTIKLSSLASVIGVSEILFQGNAIIAETYKTKTTYVAVLFSYMIIVLLFTQIMTRISITLFKK